ncbi:MAG: PHP domain-containing protein [Polyangiaceae bacterium]|nr:PHP domain-containing protein [Polyangiaceae bacterium]
MRRILAPVVALLALAPLPFTGCGEDRLLRAKQIETSFELVGGPVAMANVGDFLLENDQIRVTILGARHSPGPGVFGGSLVDADLRRGDARFTEGQGRDRFAETFPIANLLVPDPETTEVTVVNDGSSGEEARIRVAGEGAFIFDALTILRREKDLLALLFTDLKPTMRFVTDYILRPGDRFVTLQTTLLLPAPDGCPKSITCDKSCEHGFKRGSDGCLACECEEALPLGTYTGPSDIFLGILGNDQPAGDDIKGGVVAGDFVFFGNQNDIFGPGMGFDEEKTVFDAIFAKQDTFQKPLSFDFVAASGGDVSYGYFNAPPAPGQDPTRINVPVFTSAATAFLTAGVNCKADTADDAACDNKQSFTYTRYFAVGDGDIASIAEIYAKTRGAPVGTLAGNVLWASTGQPVPNAQVFLFNDPSTDKNAELPWKSVDELAEANVKAVGNVGLLNVIDADRGIDPVEDGDFAAVVQAGDYIAVVRNKEGTATSAPVRVRIDPGAETRFLPALSPPATVRYRVVDEAGQQIPAKLTFIALDEAGKPYERDGVRRVYMGVSRLGNGIRAIEYSASGQGEVMVEPGRYKILVTRGIEHGRAEIADMTLEAGELERVDAVVPREIDSSGWMSIDMHLHSRLSFDSGMDLDRRVTTAAVEGLDMAVATDHDVHTDYTPNVKKLHLEPYLKTAVGAEVSTLDLGHFIGFPLRYDETDVPDHGVHDWVCESGTDVIKGIRETSAEGHSAFTVLAHPRDGAIGYIDQLGVDPFDLTRPEPESNVLLRTAACDFDAMEIFNAKRFDLIRTPTIGEVVDWNRCLARIDAAADEAGLDGACPEVAQGRLAPCAPGERFGVCQHRNRTALAWAMSKRILSRTKEEQEAHWTFPMSAVEAEELCLVDQYGDDPVPADRVNLPCTHHTGHLDDVFRYLEYGFSPTQVGSSDGHGASIEPGTPRTFFRSPTDVPGDLQMSDALESLRGGHAFATYGPFIRATVGGKTFGEVATVQPGNAMQLLLRVETASWFGVDRVEVYSDGMLVKVLKPNKGPAAIVDVDESDPVVFPAPKHDSWVIIVAMGLNDENLMSPVSLDVPFGELQLPRIASLAFTQVEALATFFPPSPSVPDWYPIAPYAVTNPIFLDTDGNGVYDAPKGNALPPFCSRPCNPEVFDATQCPKGQTCLLEEGVCGHFVTGRCEGEAALTAALPDGDH